MNKKDSKEIRPALFLLVIILSIFLKILLIKTKLLSILQLAGQVVRFRVHGYLIYKKNNYKTQVS
ncbi:MAG: hypothetical protein KJ976_04465, partial [Proteobacteria bacterium]|nr:hypothetical protein [Pseudomonadota bacterium]